ncbi:hypothetical protein PWT90_05051 [Aphanocladium album]|nr:hypothetical protein PWT90_05051 [Aphanocladium album]
MAAHWTVHAAIQVVGTLAGNSSGKVSSKCAKGWTESKRYEDIWKDARVAYARHYSDIRALVPPEQLLEYKLTDGWEPLAKFLGKEVPGPDVEFPHLNDAAAISSAGVEHSSSSNDQGMGKDTAVAAQRNKSTVRLKKRGPAPSSGAKWLLENQFGISLSLLALLFLSHQFIPASRLYTAKFFALSYYNEQTGKYAAGYDDFYFISFCIDLLTCLRAGVMEHILAPLARRWGIASKKKATRFAEQGWMLIYYNVFWPTGMYIYYNSKYFGHMEELWTDWPQREIGGLMKAYILGQWSFWIQQVLVINMEERRKDHWQMLTHHFVTIALLAGCYAYHQTRVGNVILVLMDVIDLFLPLAKCLKYLGFGVICDVIFGGFIVSWIFARHLLYVFTCWSIYTDFPRIQKASCYHGPADNLQGPFVVPTTGWSHLVEPFLQPEGTVCLNNNIMYAFLSFLLFLQVMMIIWLLFIVKIVVRIFQGKPADDVRSNSEAEEEEDEVTDAESGRPRYPEEEVDGESLNWSARATATKSKSPGGSLHFRGRSDRKELLNRIGCEKQIE